MSTSRKGVMTTPDAPGDSELMAWIRDHRDYDQGYCLIWPFGRTSSGYAGFGRDGKHNYVHRYMCEYVNGPAPTSDYQAAHSCGRGEDGCVNPQHLSWKTPSGNQLDRHAHGSNGSGVLSQEQVDEIVSTKDTIISRVAAIKFGVSETTIRHIRSGKTWGGKKRYRYFSPDERAQIAEKLKTSVSIGSIAKEYGCSRTAISRMRASISPAQRHSEEP